MRNGMEVLYRSVWKKDSKIPRRSYPPLPRSLDCCSLLDLCSIVGMNPLQELLPAGTPSLLGKAINAINFFRPEQGAVTQVPCPTARVAEPLGFRQVRFAAAELFSQDLVLRDVYGTANELFQALVFDDRNTDAANVPDFTIGTHDALGSIEGRSFAKNPLNKSAQEPGV